MVTSKKPQDNQKNGIEKEKEERKAGLEDAAAKQLEEEFGKNGLEEMSQDLRREQLSMRASEKEKKDEEREDKKAAKAAEKKEVKPKGRPRKAEASREKVGKKKKEKKEEKEEDKGEETKKRKHAAKANEAEEGEKASEKKVKPKAKAKRTPGGPLGHGDDPQPDVEMKADMVNLMKRYMDSPYDKTKDTLRKIYSKSNSASQWGESSGGKR